MDFPRDRVDCPHAERCGGCALLHLPYSEQLAIKRDAVARAILAYSSLSTAKIGETVGAEPASQYRLRAKLVVSGRHLGLFRENSHEVVDIPECRVLSPAVAHAVSAVRDLLPLSGGLDAVDVREVDHGVLVTLVVTDEGREPAWRAVATELRARVPGVLGVALSHKPRGSARVLGGLPRPISGVRAAPHHLDASLPFHEATYGSFVQAHSGQATQLYRTIADTIAQELGGLEGQSVLELYAGAGALALLLAQRGARVTAVESFEPAVRALERAARAQSLAVRALALTAEDALQGLGDARAVLVDPPRRGLSPAVRRALGEARPDLVLYVSCEPGTLARDLAHLAELGMRTQWVRPFDMIPLSDAVEALAVLRPSEPPPITLLYEEADFAIVTKPPFLPGEGGSHSLSARVRRLPELADAVPLHSLSAELSGACVFARSRAAHPRARAALAGSAASAHALARGIVRQKGTLRRPSPGRGEALVTRYRRERVVSTHSLIEVHSTVEAVETARRHLASIGHPILGDARFGHAASNRHFAERHGLDRPFFHVSAIALSTGQRVECPLAPDLEGALASLGDRD